ncbi:MAG: hypothetical protein NTV40_04170 [Solirubrobacterales bacterium]|nr:hypothetical protein [Solirubrobacterales bacterium]
MLRGTIATVATASIEAIFIADKNGGPTRPVVSVNALAGRGLEGDRYCATQPAPWIKEGEGRDVTLIEAEALEALTAQTGINLGADASRRQLITRGIALNELVGTRFEVGGVELLGRELAHPCRYLEKLTQDGVLEGLANRGGLRAEILCSGEISVGDEITVLDSGDVTPA